METNAGTNATPVIVSTKITPLPVGFCDPMPQVIVTDSTGKETTLFSYYPDEISFTEKEFIGLTLDEGRRLRFTKERNYLRS